MEAFLLALFCWAYYKIHLLYAYIYFHRDIDSGIRLICYLYSSAHKRT